MSQQSTPSLLLRGTLILIVWSGVLGLAGATVLTFLGRLHWFFELFGHFRLQLALGLVVMLIATLLLRRWVAAGVAVLCLVPHLLTLSYYFPSRDFKEGPSDLRVLCFNVLTQNNAHDTVLRYLEASEADILFLMETNQRWVDALSALETRYPHVVKAPRDDNFGITLYSRHPISSHDLVVDERARVPRLRATIECGSRTIELHGAHPVPPVGSRQANARNAYLEGLRSSLGSSSHPAIVLGDFNATVWSPYLRSFLESTYLNDTGYKQGFQSSWRRSSPIFSLPIDHIFHNGGLVCRGREIGPAMGSDHHPVVADFGFVR